MSFDAILILDWSAASVPTVGPNSIWLAEVVRGEPLSPPVNLPTRLEARAWVLARLHAHQAAGRRVLVGCDFPYGYPAGFAQRLGLAGPAWRATWDHLAQLITDGPHNQNNRFQVASCLNAAVSGGPGPFWACPVKAETPCLTPKKPPSVGLADLREADRFAQGASSAWKCAYPGSVGSQALMGIPVVRAWRDDPALAADSAVWPFETGFRTPVAARIVHAEIYPSALKLAGDASWVRDARQVWTLAQAFAEQDAAGKLAGCFAAPPGLDEAAIARVEAEEGWILAPRNPASAG